MKELKDMSHALSVIREGLQGFGSRGGFGFCPSIGGS